jgi:hypothetical protein
MVNSQSTFVMYNTVKDISKYKPTIDSNIIIIIDPSNKSYEQNLRNAIRSGFRHPLLSTKFFGKELKKPHLFLYHKNNHDYAKKIDDETYNDVLKKARFSIRTYRDAVENHKCSIKIVLDKETIDYLHDYTKKHYFEFNGGKKEQREISGCFLLYEMYDDTFLVKVDTKNCNLGGKESTESHDTIGSFHTHPIEAYRSHGVCAAWPSVEDYMTFMAIYASGYGVFHILSSVEGIYVITMSDKLIKRKGGRTEIKENLEKYQKIIDEEYHKNYPDCKIDYKRGLKERWEKHISEYLKWINGLGYFRVQFFYWDKIENKPIRVAYRSVNGNCMISDPQVKLNVLLKNKEALSTEINDGNENVENVENVNTD